MPDVYCWEIHEDDLNIYLASSRAGAKKVGMGLNREIDCLNYFRQIFPSNRISKDHDMNRPLLQAVEAALWGNALLGDFRLDTKFTPFQMRVWEAIRRIPFGQTATYGQVARMIGRPGGARAIGQVMKRNPLPLVYP
jgi:O6-methylguanine-DNA--protein-cysteine methyltransferase